MIVSSYSDFILIMVAVRSLYRSGYSLNQELSSNATMVFSSDSDSVQLSSSKCPESRYRRKYTFSANGRTVEDATAYGILLQSTEIGLPFVATAVKEKFGEGSMQSFYFQIKRALSEDESEPFPVFPSLKRFKQEKLYSNEAFSMELAETNVVDDCFDIVVKLHDDRTAKFSFKVKATAEILFHELEKRRRFIAGCPLNIFAICCCVLEGLELSDEAPEWF